GAPRHGPPHPEEEWPDPREAGGAAQEDGREPDPELQAQPASPPHRRRDDARRRAESAAADRRCADRRHDDRARPRAPWAPLALPETAGRARRPGRVAPRRPRRDRRPLRGDRGEGPDPCPRPATKLAAPYHDLWKQLRRAG